MSKCACGRRFRGNGSKCPQCQRDERFEEEFRNTDWEFGEDEDDE